MNEVVYFLPSLKFESSLDNVPESLDKHMLSRKRKREETNQESCKQDLTVSDPLQPKRFKPSELSIQFNELLDKLIDCLECCEVPRLITKFNVLMADHASKILFFPERVLCKLHKCKTVEDLFLKL